jgi:DNA ligase-1
MPKDLIDSVRPIPEVPPKEKGKRVIKPKVEPDPAREAVEVRCMDAVRLVRKVYVRHPNYGDLAQGLDKFGLEGLEDRVQVSVGMYSLNACERMTHKQESHCHPCWVPSLVLLARCLPAWAAYPLRPRPNWTGREFRYMLERLVHKETMMVEVDGSNLAITKSGFDSSVGTLFGSIQVRELKIRHLEDMTEKYPDVCQLVLALLTRQVPSRPDFPSSASTPIQTLIDMLSVQSITSFTMDAEIVAVDKDTGAYRTFQDLSNRAKKDVRVEDIKVIVGVYAFDLMLLNDTVRLCRSRELIIAPLRFTILPPTTSSTYSVPRLLRPD